jgi:hypothetical protein
MLRAYNNEADSAVRSMRPYAVHGGPRGVLFTGDAPLQCRGRKTPDSTSAIEVLS